MATLPTVAIIGKPNTGKSRLFNRLVGRSKAIVSDIAGTTRDHIAHKIRTKAVDYLLVDTGGMGGGTDDIDLEDDVHKQSILALENADVIIFTLNSREPLTSNDFAIADILRKQKKRHVPVITVVTKCDDADKTDEVLPQFYELHVGEELIPISAPHKIGMDDLENAIERHLVNLHFGKPSFDLSEDNEKVKSYKNTSATDEDETGSSIPDDIQSGTPKIAIIGRPNVGKSSIVNALMSESQNEKSPILVSNIPGTTRDTVDMTISYHEKEYLFMDTAGIKRRTSTPEGIETFAYFRSIRALQDCDIAVLVLDVTEPVSKQDKRIAGMATDAGKGLIVLMNKWDTLQSEQKKDVRAQIEYELQFCKFASFVPCSAQTKEGLLKIFDIIEKVANNRVRRIAVKDLRRWFEDVTYGQPLGEIAKSKHITQADETPPTFVLFVKDPKRVQVSQLRFLDNRLREVFDFEGTPVRWVTKGGQQRK